uniref:Uncharacterized protein cdig1L n=1 Tax=Rattus norvegicus TaxID=10116 RepID=Q8BGA0_RAT|nr:hypothetical protein [Rattus norvegicus]BAC20213.1 hypothetical protein [Rattus norvegicus]
MRAPNLSLHLVSDRLSRTTSRVAYPSTTAALHVSSFKQFLTSFHIALVPRRRSSSANFLSRSFPSLFHEAIVNEPEQANQGATLSTSFTKFLSVLPPSLMSLCFNTVSKAVTTDCEDPMMGQERRRLIYVRLTRRKVKG